VFGRRPGCTVQRLRHVVDARLPRILIVPRVVPRVADVRRDARRGGIECLLYRGGTDECHRNRPVVPEDDRERGDKPRPVEGVGERAVVLVEGPDTYTANVRSDSVDSACSRIASTPAALSPRLSPVA